MNKRPVYIKRVGDSFLVFYADRRKGQHYTVAQFYAPDTSFNKVANWVKQQPGLQLEKLKT